jgi:hypothetical protein
MFGIESWDGNFDGLMALFSTLIFIGLCSNLAWKTRDEGTWNDVFKLYGFAMGMIFVFIVCAIIAPLPTIIETRGFKYCEREGLT